MLESVFGSRDEAVTVCSADALKNREHSVGLWPVKTVLVMLHVSLENLTASVLLLIKGTYRYFGYIDTLKYHDIS